MRSPWTVKGSEIFDHPLSSPQSYLTVGYNIFLHYLLTVTIFRRNFFCHKKCVLIFSTSTIFVWNIFIIRKERELLKVSASLHVKEPFFLSHLSEIWIFLTDVRKIFKYKFHKIPSMCTDGQTDMTKLIVTFRNLTLLIRRILFCHFCQTEKLSITQVENFVETRLLRVAQNQADSKQRDKIFIICFESPTVGKELNREKTWFKR